MAQQSTLTVYSYCSVVGCNYQFSCYVLIHGLFSNRIAGLRTLHVYLCLKCISTCFHVCFLFLLASPSSWHNSWILHACRWQSYHTLHKDMDGWGQQSGWLSFLKVLFRCFTNEILFCLWYWAGNSLSQFAFQGFSFYCLLSFLFVLATDVLPKTLSVYLHTGILVSYFFSPV